MSKELQNLHTENEKLKKQIIDLEVLVKTKGYKDKPGVPRSPADKIRKLNECLLNNTKDPLDNIKRLVTLCGNILHADAALYNKLSGSEITAYATWNVPGDYVGKSSAKGRISNDIIKGKYTENPVVFDDVMNTEYVKTDPNVMNYKFSTYAGVQVKSKNKNIGCLCVVYSAKTALQEEDIDFLNIISSAISIEEERKRAAETALRRESLYRKLFDFSPAGIIVEDLEGNILEVNEALTKILGYSQNEFSKMTVFDLVPPKVRGEVNNNIADIVSGKNLEHEVINIRKDGSLCYLELRETKFTVDESGREAILVVCNDITARKEAELALQENEENLRTLINSTPDMIVFKDAKGRWIEANKSALEVFELAGKEYKGKNDIQLGEMVPFFKSPLTLCMQSDEQAFEKQHNLRVEEHVPTRGGTTKIFDVIKVPLFYPNGKRKGLIVYGRDITNFTAVLGELIKSKDEAEAANKVKSQFLATISHEIRTPLNGVIGMTSILLDTDISGEHRESVEIIRQSGEGLLNLINEILDFSKIESGKVVLEKKPFEIKVCVNDVVDMFRAYCGRKGIRIDSNTAKDIPEFLEGDSERLKQILTNLVGNAVKFTDSGEILITVRKKKQFKKTATLLFSVSDTGEGIPPDYIADIFSPFTQADTSRKKRYGGTGLGLSISKRLVELMGGKIWCKSELGKGTTFFFTADLDQTDIGEKSMNEPGKQFDFRDVAKQYPHKILLVEDNPINQKVAQRILKKFGYAIDISCNGLEALNVLREKTYDIIFMDIQMPEMDGLEATRKILEIYGEKSPHIIAMTAAVMKGDKERCLEAGMIDYIPKPVVPDVVLNALKKYGRPV